MTRRRLKVNRFFLNVALAFVPVVFLPEPGFLHFFISFVVVAVGISLLEPRKRGRGYGTRLLRAVPFAAFYILEVVLSSFRVAQDVIRPRPRMTPAIVAVPLEDGHTDTSVTALGNLITMTPGTMTLDVSEDRRWIYIHAMYAEDVERFRREFKKDFEERVLRVMTPGTDNGDRETPPESEA